MKALKTFFTILVVLVALFSVIGIIGLAWLYFVGKESFENILEGEKDSDSGQNPVKKLPVKVKAVSSKVEKPSPPKVDQPLTEKKYSNLNERQQKILKEVKNQKKVKSSEIRNQFKNINERTLRRDFDKLEKLGIVRQLGKTKDSFYEYLR